MYSLAVILLISYTGLGQIDCSKYYPMREGMTMQYTNYNKKGKSEGTVNYLVSNVSNEGGMTKADMSMTLKNEKGKEVFTSDYSIRCEDDKIAIDYNSLLPDNMMEQMGNMEMEVTGTDIELPNSLNVGDTLSDANVTMTMSMGGMNMKTEIFILNRKVEKKEVINTPAGEFDCYVIYSDTQTRSMGINRTFPSRQWLAEGIGMVKQESYQKDGDLINSTLLTAYSQ
ncbi:hypothetical protein GWK09_14500 [Muriicola jejuensis]|uniref:DUF3108 domain-containing protein n=2 Tax=Muriicola jejuensis TaxID=504488 RepID=A0A6P0UIM6_9FLAO|nr:hypothetical protein [Muriicola jejuensis]